MSGAALEIGVVVARPWRVCSILLPILTLASASEVLKGEYRGNKRKRRIGQRKRVLTIFRAVCVASRLKRRFRTEAEGDRPPISAFYLFFRSFPPRRALDERARIGKIIITYCRRVGLKQGRRLSETAANG